MGLLDEADDLELLGRGVSHASSPPSPIMLFFSRRSSRACSATTSFSARAWREVLDLVGGRRTRRVAGQAPLAGFQELLRPAVVQALGDALAAAQLGDACPRRAGLRARCGSCLRPNSACGSRGGCRARPARPALWRAGFLSHLHSSVVTMSQKSSVPQARVLSHRC